MATTPKQAHFEIPVECKHCKAKQIVHTTISLAGDSDEPQAIQCVECKKQFDVMVSHKIIGGPYSA